MHYVMSCSHDSACSLLLVDSHGRKESCTFRVRKGITTFDYSKEWNIIGEREGNWPMEFGHKLAQPTNVLFYYAQTQW